jgi:hypothetical protein
MSMCILYIYIYGSLRSPPLPPAPQVKTTPHHSYHCCYYDFAIIGVISEQVLAQLDEIASCMAIVSKKPNMWF